MYPSVLTWSDRRLVRIYFGQVTNQHIVSSRCRSLISWVYLVIKGSHVAAIVFLSSAVLKPSVTWLKGHVAGNHHISW